MDKQYRLAVMNNEASPENIKALSYGVNVSFMDARRLLLHGYTFEGSKSEVLKLKDYLDSIGLHYRIDPKI